MNKIFLPLLCMMLMATSAIAQKTYEPTYFYAFGDMPYEDHQVTPYKRLVQLINDTNPAFSIHVGDTKSGHSYCSDEFYAENLKHLNQFKQPLLYTPGDNEWTDCDREDCGSYNATERLNFLRKTLFMNPSESFGINRIPVISQSSYPSYGQYVENAMWVHKDILFSTVHICGSSNNYLEEGDNSEFIEREAADLFWLKTIFEKAQTDNVRGVVLAFHANVFNNQNNIGYKRLLEELRKLIFEFGKPVLAIYGDTHNFVINQPLRYEGKLLKNFTALQVFGSPNIHLIKVHVDKENDDLFDIEPFYID